jgi:hypothetical protein
LLAGEHPVRSRAVALKGQQQLVLHDDWQSMWQRVIWNDGKCEGEKLVYFHFNSKIHLPGNESCSVTSMDAKIWRKRRGKWHDKGDAESHGRHSLVGVKKGMRGIQKEVTTSKRWKNYNCWILT